MIRITNQRDLRKAFRQMIRDSGGTEKPSATDLRCMFVDYVDSLARDGTISESLAQRATLEE